MGTYKVRYLVAKKQKSHTLYYWQPKKEYYPHFLTMPLGKDFAQAVIQAEKYNAELDAWRKTGVEPNAVREGSFEWLTEEYRKSLWFKELAPKTQKGYEIWMKRINKTTGKMLIQSITRAVCKGYYKKLAEESLSNANAALRVFKILFSFAIDEGLITENPAKGIRMSATEPRHQVWSRDEVRIFIQKAVESNRRSIALAVKLAESLGQRQGDILKLQWSQYNGKTIQLKQNKTGSILEIPCFPELRKWLANTPRISTHIVVSETTKRPYKEDNFQHIFGAIMSTTGIEDRLFMDLRRTAAVRLAEAGCTALEITAITGHKIDSGAKILETYAPRTNSMAENAISKLEDYKINKLDL